MIGAVFLLVLLFLMNQIIFGTLKKRHPFFSTKLMNLLYGYHMFFWLVYYIYVQFNSSDNDRYFNRPQTPGFSWFDFYGTSTTFIDFAAYPFVNYLNLNFEMTMMVFAWFGYLGFVFAYLFFRENIPVKVKVFNKFDMLTVLLFLPNMHFWTAALAKGAPIFLGLMMFVYALTNLKKRWLLLLIGAILVYHVRPHVFMFMAVGTVLGYMSGSEKVSMGKKLVIFAGMIGGLIVAQDQILALVGMEDGSGNLVEGIQNFSEDRSEALLNSGGSGVDLASYPMPIKLFTFWFRPLFIDAPNPMGLIVSTENLLYLILVFKIVNRDFWRFLKNANSVVKTSLIMFFLTSVAMTFVMSNLGIIIRQKSMVMYFLFFVIYYFLAEKKYKRILKMRWKRKQHALKQTIKV